MKISLSNILLLVVIASLVIALVVVDRTEKSILLGDGFNHLAIWQFEDSAAGDSVWKDTSEPPPLQVHQVFGIVDRLRAHMEDAKEQIKFCCWEINGIYLEKLQRLDWGSEPDQSWVYVVRMEALNYPVHFGINNQTEVVVLVLMDGSMRFDAQDHEQIISETVLEFPGVKEASPDEAERAAALKEWDMVGGVF